MFIRVNKGFSTSTLPEPGICHQVHAGYVEKLALIRKRPEEGIHERQDCQMNCHFYSRTYAYVYNDVPQPKFRILFTTMARKI